jgi:hypothetical protein
VVGHDPEQFGARHDRHLEIENDKGRLVSREHVLERSLAVRRFAHLETMCLEQLSNGRTTLVVVLND